MKVSEIFESETIKIKPDTEEVKKAKDFIKRVYDKYPKWPLDARQRCMVWGEGDDQEFVNFELEPSFTKRGAVEVKWFASYPHRKGVGLRGIKALQDEARTDGISLTLFPWDKGKISQTALVKFYKKGGFQAVAKGSKNMHWSPEEKVGEDFDPYKIHNLANPKDKEVSPVTKVEDLAEILKAQCSEIIKAYKIAGDPLYRGISDANSSDQVIITAIRKDRKPVEMKGKWHEILHDAFIEYGLKATRKNAIFCTTSKRIAEDWGNVYVIFPKDGWSVTIFEKFVDDYTFYKLSSLKHHRAIEDAKSNQEKYDYIGDCLSEMKAKNITTAEGLGKVIAAGYEDILLTGSSYIGIKLKSPMLSKLSKLLGIRL